MKRVEGDELTSGAGSPAQVIWGLGRREERRFRGLGWLLAVCVTLTAAALVVAVWAAVSWGHQVRQWQGRCVAGGGHVHELTWDAVCLTVDGRILDVG